MHIVDFLLHLLHWLAPAACMAVVLPLLARLGRRRALQLLPLPSHIGILFVLGCLVLGFGLVLTGDDGRIATYAALVLACASCQWLLGQGWKSAA